MQSVLKSLLTALMVGAWTALFTLGVLYVADDNMAFQFERIIAARLDRIEAMPGDLAARVEGLEATVDKVQASLGGAAESLEDAIARLDNAVARIESTAGAPAATDGGDRLPVPQPRAAAMQQPAAAPMVPAATGATTEMVLTIDFLEVGSFDGDWLDGAVAEKVALLVEAMAGRSRCAVAVTGHADTVGRDEFNQTLSRKRAAAVTRRLARMLAASGRDEGITVAPPTAWGERRLSVLTADGVDERANRRVDISLRCAGSNAQS